MGTDHKQEIVSYFFSKIPSAVLGKLTRTKLLIPYYHLISDDRVIHVQHLYKYKNIKQFECDMDYLLQNYRSISLFDLLDFLKNGRSIPDNAFLLTFDDGFREMYDIVAPILLRKGIPATFFVNSDFLDNKNLCYQHKASLLVENLIKTTSLGSRKNIIEKITEKTLISNDFKTSILSINYQQKDIIDEIAQLLNVDFDDYLLKYKPYLTSDQIRKLKKDGFTIGAHSIDHPLYSSLSFNDQLIQTIESVKFFKNRFSLNYGAFAFPHTDRNVSKQFYSELNNSGIVDVLFGTSGMLEDSFSNSLQRFNLEKPLLPAERIIALQYARKLFKIFSGKSRIIRQ